MNYKTKLNYAWKNWLNSFEMINSNNDNDWWTVVRRNWKRGEIE
ncbi:MAG: hypothetical protein ACTS45_01060 [Candidatus Hodgkinia cicadicola]